jgi:hypothetical protein
MSYCGRTADGRGHQTPCSTYPDPTVMRIGRGRSGLLEQRQDGTEVGWSNLPELVPTFKSKSSWSGKSPMVHCKRRRNSDGTAPRVPPPSMQRMLTPVCDGLSLIVNAISVSHIWHFFTPKRYSTPGIATSNRRTQALQIEWPHGRTCCSGVIARQTIQVWLVLSSPHCRDLRLKISILRREEVVYPCRRALARWTIADFTSAQQEWASVVDL